MIRSAVAASLLTLGTLAVGCSTAEGNDPSSSANAVTAAPESTAVGLMNAVWQSHDFDYLPWSYAPDGCFDRSYYLSMEFASRGFPVREQVINVRWNADGATNKAEFVPVDQSGGKIEFKGKQVKWQYHIAAVLMPGAQVDVTEPMIIDRALEPGPVTVDKWISDANSSHLPVTPADDPPISKDDLGAVTRGFNEFKTRGAPYVGFGPLLNGDWESFEDEPELIPTFEPSTVQIACNTLWTIWVDCMGADPIATANMLESKTNSLLQTLNERHGLSEPMPAQPITCGRNDKFVCAKGAQ